MAVTVRAEDGEARSFIRPLEDAACSKCTRSIMTKSAVARSVATAAAPGRAAMLRLSFTLPAGATLTLRGASLARSGGRPPEVGISIPTHLTAEGLLLDVHALGAGAEVVQPGLADGAHLRQRGQPVDLGQRVVRRRAVAGLVGVDGHGGEHGRVPLGQGRRPPGRRDVDADLAQRVATKLGTLAPMAGSLPEPAPSPALSIINLAGEPSVAGRMRSISCSNENSGVWTPMTTRPSSR